MEPLQNTHPDSTGYCENHGAMGKISCLGFSNSCLNLQAALCRQGASPMATSVLTKPAAKGGSFLLESAAPTDIFTPADLSDDQKLIGQTAEEFVIKEVLPLPKYLENKKPSLMADLVRKPPDLGLLTRRPPHDIS